LALSHRARVLAAAALCAPAALAAQTGELPRTHAPRPTQAALTPADLMTRLYILADDSMKGRASGTPGNAKGTGYIAAEFRRIGLEPAGDNGTFFQTIPLIVTGLEGGANLSVDGAALRGGSDWVPLPSTLGSLRFGGALDAGGGVQAVFGGRIGGETLAPAQAAGRLVVLLPPLENGRPAFRFWRGAGFPAYPQAAGVAVVSLEATPAGTVAAFVEPRTALGDAVEAPAAPAPAGILLSTAAAERILGAPLASLKPGAAGKTVRGAFRYLREASPSPARNVVGILRGSDPRLSREYVVIGAHNDHDPMLEEPVDHDSVKAYNRVMRPRGANDPVGTPTAQQWTRINAIRDSLKRAHGGVARLDSVMNGADDDGSGTVVLMEIAEELASRRERPLRSILFVSHTAEELGLYGSEHFTDHPTVPRESIVAALNMDMVGRGRAEEVPGGGPRYIQLIGSRRLSTQLGDAIDSLNAARSEKMDIDYSFDAAGHPLNRYCRSDHYNYARYGIPITYFSLGYTTDYHQATDEPQYIDYDHSARVGGFVRDIALTVANRRARIVVDKPKPDPNAPCRQ
jgi:hypothetical protein